MKKKKLYSKVILTKPHIRASKIKIFKDQLKKSLMKDTISIDETGIDTHIEHNYGWSKFGKKIIMSKTYPRKRYTMITALGFKEIIHSKIINGSCNGEIFLKFIKELLKKSSIENKWSIIIDNARIHHYKKFKEYIKNFNNINIIYNVPYSPETNPIEKVFKDIKKYLKETPINNNNIYNKINRSLRIIKEKNIKKYYIKAFTYYQ